MRLRHFGLLQLPLLQIVWRHSREWSGSLIYMTSRLLWHWCWFSCAFLWCWRLGFRLEFPYFLWKEFHPWLIGSQPYLVALVGNLNVPLYLSFMLCCKLQSYNHTSIYVFKCMYVEHVKEYVSIQTHVYFHLGKSLFGSIENASVFLK